MRREMAPQNSTLIHENAEITSELSRYSPILTIKEDYNDVHERKKSISSNNSEAINIYQVNVERMEGMGGWKREEAMAKTEAGAECLNVDLYTEMLNEFRVWLVLFFASNDTIDCDRDNVFTTSIDRRAEGAYH